MKQERALAMLGYLLISIPALALASLAAGDGWTWWDERPWQLIWLFFGISAVMATPGRK